MASIILLALVIAVVLAAFGLFTAMSHRARTPFASHHFEDRDADARRVRHDLDTVRTRFERQPVWPSSGALGERR